MVVTLPILPGHKGNTRCVCVVERHILKEFGLSLLAHHHRPGKHDMAGKSRPWRSSERMEWAQLKVIQGMALENGEDNKNKIIRTHPLVPR